MQPQPTKPAGLGRVLAWLKRLFWGAPPAPHLRHKRWPTREEIADLPLFEGLELDQIIQIETPEGAKRAYEEIINAGVVGFDTESKPTFKKGEVSTGPHVVQFSTLDRAYVFILHHAEIRRVAGALIHAEGLKKVGFGLSDDLRRIPIRLHVQPRSVLDVETLFTAKGYGRGVGVKVGVAITLKRRFIKSKKASTSNWMKRDLTEKQLLYAANDAYAAIRVYRTFDPD